MKISQKNLAAQLYTLREFTKTPKDIAETMKKVKQIGYDAVQISALGPIDPKELAAILDGEGLVCCASHDGGEDLFNKTDELIEKLHAVKCAYTAYPWPRTSPKTEEEWVALAKRLDAVGAKLREAGITLCYHNHNIEFAKYNGRTALDIIYSASCADNLKGEPDTHWVQLGGANPVTWCRKLSGRLPLLHMKDTAYINGQSMMTEIGNGNLEWKNIVAAADEAGCKWYIVEEDTCPGNPFDSLKQSYEYIKEELF